MEFVLIEAGEFMMGTDCIPGASPNCSANETPAHKVAVKAFYMGIHEVTQGQWYKVMGSASPAYFNGDRLKIEARDYPVENVSWDDAQNFIKRLNALEKTDKYRLPTEAEWEYAARGGTTTVYWWGDDVGQNNANCNGCGSQWDGKQTAPVDSFKPNPFGLYNTAGNVWEWTCSRYTEKYDGSELKCDMTNDSKSLRGGSWIYGAGFCRVAFRGSYTPASRFYFNGFRVLLVLP